MKLSSVRFDKWGHGNSKSSCSEQNKQKSNVGKNRETQNEMTKPQTELVSKSTYPRFLYLIENTFQTSPLLQKLWPKFLFAFSWTTSPPKKSIISLMPFKESVNNHSFPIQLGQEWEAVFLHPRQGIYLVLFL